MKKIMVALCLVAFAGTAFAADSITMKKGVVFNHKAHSEALKDCTKCHAAATGGKIDGFGSWRTDVYEYYICRSVKFFQRSGRYYHAEKF